MTDALLYRLSLKDAAPWFDDMRESISETAAAARIAYAGQDDPPEWASRAMCLDDDLTELER